LDEELDRIGREAIRREKISREDAGYLACDSCDLESLLDWAGRIRDKFCEDRVYRCSILNARSGLCPEDCAFCAQSSLHDAQVDQYPLLSPEQIVEAARKAAEEGVDCFGIVTSGRRLSRSEIDGVADTVRTCHSAGIVRIGASLGIMEYDDLVMLKEAGLVHYNHNLETSRDFYPRICTTHSWDLRRRTVEDAIRAGLEVCSGGIFGLGESWGDRIDLAMVLRQLGVSNVPLNFLSPIPGTPMQDNIPMDEAEALRLIAVFRFMLPGATLRICGGRPVTFPERGEDIFRAGASGILTGDYLTTKGYSYESDREMIGKLGLRY
jgi:biotin synthase